MRKVEKENIVYSWTLNPEDLTKTQVTLKNVLINTVCSEVWSPKRESPRDMLVSEILFAQL